MLIEDRKLKATLRIEREKATKYFQKIILRKRIKTSE
jgi:hypothetical protein